jgi:hypothetical protein
MQNRALQTIRTVTNERKGITSMSLRKHGLKALGLTFFAALALMAISAPGASAIETGKLLILNAAKTVLTELHASFTASIDLLGVLHVPVINLEIHCTTLTTHNGLYLTAGEPQVAHVTLLYSGCTLYQLSPLSLLAGCEVYPTAADRTAGTNAGKIYAEVLLTVLKGGAKPLLRAKPKVAGGNFAHLFFKNCPIGATALISGGLTLLAHDGPTNHLVKHLFEEATGTNKKDQLKYGLNDANILGSIWVELTGGHATLEWGLC